MASPGSYIRSAARATSSAFSRLPIRWRLAGGSAVLTLVILMAFAGVVGTLTTRQIRKDFDQQVNQGADELRERSRLIRFLDGTVTCGFNLDVFAGSERGVARLVSPQGQLLSPECASEGAPDLGPPVAEGRDFRGFRVESRPVRLLPFGEPAVVQYARRLDRVEATMNRVWAFLGLGVLAGAGLALLAGLATARRAMSPIAELTAAVREVERTRDPGQRVPHPEADDEVAELARTLEDMLHALDAARGETEAALARQRQFVGDASHELRTPLTSVLANLELLSEELEGEERETALAALRSTRRMRRLVGDLLLLARADAGQVARRGPVDLGAILVEAAAELEPVAGDHDLSVDPRPVVVEGARDELHRMALNLMENALGHTPPGTRVHARLAERDGRVELAVEDGGPGIPPELAPRIFDRFVRGVSDRGGGSTGLGLAIVRAVAESHGGSVALETPADGGARFVVSLPAARGASPGEPDRAGRAGNGDARREAGARPKTGASWKRPSDGPG